jgi:hypothetical protein
VVNKDFRVFTAPKVIPETQVPEDIRDFPEKRVILVPLVQSEKQV